MRIEAAEDGVAIGDGRLRAAAVEADRAGIGARTFRPEATFLVSGSTLRIMPAPAPIVSRCSVGTLSLKRSISGSFSIASGRG
jgi:hypothetical protein